MINPQTSWNNDIENSAYTIGGFIKEFEIPYSTLRSWLRGESTPRQKNLEKMEKAMKKVYSVQKIQRHPSYGYATPEQIEKLSSMGMGPDRDALMAKIQEQNTHQGKTRF